MSDPYRLAPLTCLACKLPLRAFGTRLVCDDCGAMMIDLPDLETSLSELDADHLALAFGDREAVPERCPRCELPMQAAPLHRGRPQLLPRVLHCAKHGAWLPGGVLVNVFQLIGHQAPPRMSADEYTGGLRIGNWRSKARPRDHAPPIDRFSGTPLPCPVDGTALVFGGDRHACPACAGVLLAADRLVEIIGEVTGAPYELVPPAGAAGTTKCPACADLMTDEVLETAGVARCAEHGVWFPAGALEAALAHVVGAPQKLGGFWSRLFGR
jgi:hypothetical protein